MSKAGGWCVGGEPATQMMILEQFGRLRGWWMDRHPWWRLVMALVALGVVGVCGLKPAWHAFRAWRVERNLAAAKEAVKAVRMDEARDLSLTVLRAGDPRIEALRILEQSMESLRDPMHGEIARALMSHPEGSDEDRLKGLKVVASGAPLGLVGQAWVGLPEECQRRPEFAVAFAGRLLASHRHGEALKVLLGVPEDRWTPEVRRGVVRVLAGSGSPEGRDEAQRRLAAWWPSGEAGESEWLEVLEELPVLSLRPDLLAPVRASLARHVSPERADAGEARWGMALARIEYMEDFKNRAEVIDRAVKRWRDVAPVMVAGFLRDLGLFRELLGTFPVAEAKGQPELVPLQLRALEETGDWAGVKPLLETAGESAMAKFETLAHLAVAAGKVGDSTAFREQWEAALADAKFNTEPDACLRLSRIAAAAELKGEAALAMLAAVQRGRGPLPLFSEIRPAVEWLVAQGRENSLMEVCAIYLLFEPGNPVLLTQYAYLACLNGLVEPANILKAIKPLAEALPNEFPLQCVLAVAHLCNQDPAAALAVVDPLKIDVVKLSPGYRAVVLATLVTNGRITRDDPRITGFPWKALLPSERRRFSEWVKVPVAENDPK